MTQYDSLTKEERELDGLMDSHCSRPDQDRCNQWTREGGTCLCCPIFKPDQQ